MSGLSEIKNARSADEIAQEIEPLAQALAMLSEEARKTLTTLPELSRQQAGEWGKQQTNAAEALHSAAQKIRQASGELRQSADYAKRIAEGWSWKVWTAVLFSPVLTTLVLLTAFWLWSDPHLVIHQDEIWLRLKK